MGVYYRSISLKSVKIDGRNVAFTNCYGKAPAFHLPVPAHWIRFCDRATTNAEKQQNARIGFIMDVRSMKELLELGSCSLAVWTGTSHITDAHWDKNTVGRVVVRGIKHKRLSIVLFETTS